MPDLSPLVAGDPPRIGSYTLTGRLGTGGQGTVYHAVGASGEAVAVKWIRPDLTGDKVSIQRFLREVQAAKRVAPFCTAQIIDTGVEHERPYIVSEYIEGPSLQQSILASGPIRGNALHRLAIGTATALAAIHRAGIVHRDFKPPNVLMGPDGPRVIDFGISRALDVTSSLTSVPIGTPAFMAPEQFHGKDVGPAVDMFAWASTMAYAATGRSPFAGDTLPVVINRILNTEPAIENIEGRLRDLVVSCLSKDPTQRPTAQQVIEALLEQSGPTPTPPAVNPGDAFDRTTETKRYSPQAWQPPASPPMPLSPLPAASLAGATHEEPQTGPEPEAVTGPVSAFGNYLRRPYAKAISAGAVAVVAVATTALVLSSAGGQGVTGDAARTHTSLTPTAPAQGGGQAAAGMSAVSPTPAPSPTPTDAVPTTALEKRKLPGLSATLYDHPDDAASLVSYTMSDSKGNTKAVYIRSSYDKSFKKRTQYFSVEVSPNGKYGAGTPRKFYSGYDSVDIINMESGRVTKVKTVPSPQEEWRPHWSRDSKRLLLTARQKKGSKWVNVGFIVVDVAKKKAKVVKINDPTIASSSFGWDGEDKGVVAYFKTGKTKGLRFYSLQGKVLRDITNVSDPTWDDARGLFTPSGASFISFCIGSDEELCVWDTANGQERTRFSSDCTGFIGWYDEEHIVCFPSDEDKAIVVVDLKGRTVRTLVEAGSKAIKNFAVSVNFRYS
ncbi:serine/threonine protein kinase [Acrocarpospora catenulata]|uniref:serine/threonine protein kinase n=1 Tax=Acrocarpospora catenulata TaxID=2836182 RepID=UPI001BD9E748|nr:serine/threonine-protein kinase [Acrocarpospora catenulata]